MKSRRNVILLLLLGIVLTMFVYPAPFNRAADRINGRFNLASKTLHVPHVPERPFRLGLDLLGGTHLVYQADTAITGGQSIGDAMEGVRDVIERRVNSFGVAEPLIQIEGENRLVVELAGISDVNEAIKLIGQTPFLEFKEERTASESKKIIDKDLPKIIAQQPALKGLESGNFCQSITGEALSYLVPLFTEDPCYKTTGLTGKYLDRSQIVFDPTTGRPQVQLQLNSEGAKIFEEITRRSVGRRVAILLDGIIISDPVVNSVITTNSAIISSPTFTTKTAKDLVNRLNAGALPIPVTLVSQQTIGPSLGAESLAKSLKAGLYGFAAVVLFMLVYYRLPGLMADIALALYVLIVLAIYKAMPVTITLSGIAGFILSLGIAVDANVLIFARMREELKAGRSLQNAFHEGFRRAWLSIRDSHVTTLIGAAVLYIFSTSIVRGFALTLGIGVLISLFSSIVITRNFLSLFITNRLERARWLF